jgi:glyoxylase-like metal-dependent hydrolase (beta-lactamase superfamily II)
MSEAEQGPPPPDVDETGIMEVADGVWVIPDRRVPLVPNIGIVEGEDALLVVDTAMGPRNGARVLAVAKEKAAGRRLLATSTHFHPEHGFGLQVFRPEATIVYNRSQLEELHLKGEGYIGLFRTFGPTVEAALEGVELVEPHVVYDGEADLDLGGRSVQFRTRGLAHTRGDQIVFLPEERILFTGDLVESRIFPIYPYFPPDDTDVNGSAWIDVLSWLEGLEPEIVVPGHGELGPAGVVTTARVYHELLREETFQLADAGLDADAAVAELEPAVLERYPDWEQPEWVGFGIRCFHAERNAAVR